MLIVADIGNSTVHVGLCRDGKIVRMARARMDEIARGDGALSIVDGLEAGEIRATVMATVNPAARGAFIDWSRKAVGLVPEEIGGKNPVPIRAEVDRPEEVGVDRLLNALSAFERYGGPCIVVDFGTAITLDGVSSEGAYVGGAIAPGLRLSAEALWDRAAMIPPVEIRSTHEAIGRNTETAVRIGVIQGAVGLVDRLVRRMKPVLGGEARVIATGGDADLVAPLSEVIGEVIPELTLDGLRIAYERSVPGGGSHG
ncbi:MAG: type III pantothenate kinase [Planctomycetota bacterium]|nr:type III pantothenate kinase [Planctomycetota bacterium]